MTKLGVSLIVIGVGSFILPLMGLQFKLMSLFGDATPIVAIVVALAGVALIIIQKAKDKKHVQDMMKESDSEGK